MHCTGQPAYTVCLGWCKRRDSSRSGSAVCCGVLWHGWEHTARCKGGSTSMHAAQLSCTHDRHCVCTAAISALFLGKCEDGTCVEKRSTCLAQISHLFRHHCVAHMHGSVTHMVLSLAVWKVARHARVPWHGVPSIQLVPASRAPLRHLTTTPTLSLLPDCHASMHNPATQLLARAHQPTLVTRAALLATRHYTTMQRANSTLGAAAPTLKPRTTSPTHTSNPGGWTSRDVLNTANLLSLSRLLSGPGTSILDFLHAAQSVCMYCTHAHIPGIAALIVNQQWHWALPCLAAAGITDWLDGLAARWLPGSSPSVLGSYLDPLADKVLICCVVGALGWEVCCSE